MRPLHCGTRADMKDVIHVRGVGVFVGRLLGYRAICPFPKAR